MPKTFSEWGSQIVPKSFKCRLQPPTCLSCCSHGPPRRPQGSRMVHQVPNWTMLPRSQFKAPKLTNISFSNFENLQLDASEPAHIPAERFSETEKQATRPQQSSKPSNRSSKHICQGLCRSSNKCPQKTCRKTPRIRRGGTHCNREISQNETRQRKSSKPTNHQIRRLQSQHTINQETRDWQNGWRQGRSLERSPNI